MHTETADINSGSGVIALAPLNPRKPGARTEELLRMILALSTNFIILPAEEIDEGIRDVLGAVGNFASVDRCYVFQSTENGEKMNNTHAWCAQDFLPEMARLRNLSMRDLPWFFEQVGGLSAIQVPDTGLLPPEARIEEVSFLGPEVKSFLIVPMACADTPIGFLGLDSVSTKGAWDEEIIALLKIVGEIFVNALARKRGAEALAASEEKYRNIFENAIEGIFQATPDGRLLSVNPAMARMYGYASAGEMVEKVSDIGRQGYVHADQLEDFKRLIERKGRVEGLVVQQRRRDGSRFWASINGRVVKGGDGTILYYEGSQEDITARRDAEEQLSMEREIFRTILQKAPYGMALVNTRGTYLYVNPEYTNLTGYTLDDIRRDPHWLSRAYPDPEYRRQVIAFRNERSPGEHIDRVFTVRCKNGESKEMEFRKVFLEDGKSVITLSDITEKRRAVEALRESEEKFRTLFEDSKDAIYIAAPDGWFLDCNKSFLNLFGYTKEEVLKLNAVDMYVNKEDGRAMRRTLIKKGAVRDYELKLTKRDGHVMDCVLTMSEKRARDGAVIGYQGIVRDITTFRRAQETVRHMAYHDALTGLPNRLLFGDRLSIALTQAKRNGERVAVAVIDLDTFKNVNDLLGHKAGDSLLKAAANRLSSVLRKGDTVARMGGDEFFLVLNEIADVEDVEVIASKVVDAFRKTFTIDSRRLSVTTSMGIAIFPYDGNDAEALVRRADAAMYAAKKSGKNRYSRYTPDME